MNTRPKHIRLMSLLYIFSIAFGCTLLFSTFNAQAQFTPFNKAKNKTIQHSQTHIIPEYSAIKPGDEITLATQIDLSPHWHAYWRNPGDSGLPISIKWDLPEGFEISNIKWPTPDKISYDSFANYGHFDHVTLLQTLKAPAVIPQEKITLKAQINILVCNDICVPESHDIQLYLNDPDNLDIDNTAAIKAAYSTLPQPITGQFFFRDETDIRHLSLLPDDRTILSHATQDNIEFFPYQLGIINYSATPDVTIGDGKITIAHEKGSEPIDPEKILEGLLVIKGNIGRNAGYIIKAMPAGVHVQSKTNVDTTNHSASHLTWLSALVLAFLGGLALNLIPCVFPVLSIKALSLVEMKNEEAAQARLHGFAYTGGVVLSFILIAGTLIAFKHAGAAIGWGFQLQSPLIVGMLAYLLFIIGLNLAGLFEINTRLSNLGSTLTHHHSYMNSFFTGTLATIVATPCTAPFMGAAMGFALTQNAAVSLSVFAMLGFGLALPYLLLCLVPALRAFLPKPGPWMGTFRQLLAFPIFASSLWLVWVLGQQTGTSGTFLALLGILSIAFAVWLSRLIKPNASGIRTRLVRASVIMAIIGTIYTLTTIHYLPAYTKIRITEFGTAYSQTALSELLRGNDPVFVEMGAAWCITCKLNHASVINSKSTRALFEREDIHYVYGSWTNKNAEITAYLNAFERNGVPLYVYYSKRNPATKLRPQPVILPQILTFGRLRKTIENCKDSPTIFFYNPLAHKGGDPCSFK